MKYIINKVLAVVIGSVLLYSCENNTTEGVTKTTYYVNLELKGESTVELAMGTPYQEPGCIATENGEDVSDKVVIKGEVDSNKAGIYYRSYSAVNVDGFAKSIKRTIIIYNPAITTDISGTYTVAPGSYRMMSGTQADFSGFTVNISKELPGVFKISDLLGGYYDQGRNYGPDYAMGGTIGLGSDNSITAFSGYVPGFGDTYDSLTNGTFDPATSTLTWDLAYAGQMTFHIILKK